MLTSDNGTELNRTGNRLQLDYSDGPPPVIRAVGELDFENCQAFSDFLDHRFDDVSELQLELGELDFCDSSGLRVLIVAALAARRNGGMIAIGSMSEQLERMLVLSGFDSLFDISAERKEQVKQGPSSGQDEMPLLFSVLATLDSCRSARNRVCHYARGLGFDAPALEDIRLAVGEAMSNAVRHGNCQTEPIRLECSHNNGHLSVSLKYPSDRFDPDAICIPTQESGCKGGMGIYFMRLVMDSVDYEFGDGWVTVLLGRSKQSTGQSHMPGFS